MFKNILISLSALCLCSSAFAYDAQVCKKQKQTLEKQIQDAREYGNVQRQKNLEKALERVDKVCTKSEQRRKAAAVANTDAVAVANKK